MRILIKLYDSHGNWYGEFDTPQDAIDEYEFTPTVRYKLLHTDLKKQKVYNFRWHGAYMTAEYVEEETNGKRKTL